MFQFLSFKNIFLLSFSLFLSSSVFSFNPLETLLWPDPDFKTKLSFTKFLNFKKLVKKSKFKIFDMRNIYQIKKMKNE